MHHVLAYVLPRADGDHHVYINVDPYLLRGPASGVALNTRKLALLALTAARKPAPTPRHPGLPRLG